MSIFRPDLLPELQPQLSPGLLELSLVYFIQASVQQASNRTHHFLPQPCFLLVLAQMSSWSWPGPLHFPPVLPLALISNQLRSPMFPANHENYSTICIQNFHTSRSLLHSALSGRPAPSEERALCGHKLPHARYGVRKTILKLCGSLDEIPHRVYMSITCFSFKIHGSCCCLPKLSLTPSLPHLNWK